MTVPLPPDGDTSWSDWAAFVHAVATLLYGSTAAGRSVLTAADAAAARTATGASRVTVDGSYVDTYAVDSTPITKADVGLGNVDNTSDVNKPVSTAQLALINSFADAGTSLWQSGRAETGSRLGAVLDNLLTSGRLWLSYFYCPRAVTLTKLGFTTGNGAAAGLTLSRLALFTVAADDAVTKVAQTASDTTMGATAFATFERALSTVGGFPASYTLVPGQRYAMGLLQVGTTTSQVKGIDNGTGYQIPPVYSRYITAAQTDIAASYAVSATTMHFNGLWLYGAP